MKKSIFGIILLTFFSLIVTGCATHVGQSTPKTQQDEKANTVEPLSNRSAQVADTMIKITKEQAVAQAQQDLLSLLGIKTGDAKQVELVNDPFTMSEYWDVQFEGISVNLDSVSGTVLAISPYIKRVSSEQFTIKDKNKAEKAARELYSKLHAPQQYKLTSLKMGYGGDFWTTTWQKEVIPGIFSAYESVNLTFSSDKGELMGYNLFNAPAKSLDIKVSQEEAVNTAKTIAESKGFDTFVDAKLEVKQPNNSLEIATTFKTADYVTLVWTVTYKSSKGLFDSKMMVYVDSSTGLAVGGDQTK